MSQQSKYVIQLDEKSFCPTCNDNVFLFCRRDGNNKFAWFYICFACAEVAQVGVGKINYE